MGFPQSEAERLDVFRRSITNHRPTDAGVRDIEQVRLLALGLADEIIHRTKPSREASLALTHLEETVMWAVKSIVLGDPNAMPMPFDSAQGD